MHAPVLLFLSNLFSGDMIIIVLVALVLFGGDKLPEIARGLGKGIRDFKDASEGVKREINAQIYSYEEKKAEAAAAAKYEAERTETPASESVSTVPNTVPMSEFGIAENTGPAAHEEENKAEEVTTSHTVTHEENIDRPAV